MTPIELHVSSVEDYNKCPRRYEYRYRHGVEDDEYKPALVIGSAMHKAGAVIRSGGLLVDAQDAARVYMDGKAAPRDIHKVRAMIAGYWASLYLPGPHIWTLDNEVELHAPLRNPTTGYPSRDFSIGGTADGVVDSDGGPLLYEMKTTSDTLDAVESYLNQSIQIPAYQEMLRLDKGIEVVGTIIDIIKKPLGSMKPYDNKKHGKETLEDWSKRLEEAYSEDPGRFFRRVVIDYSEARVEETMNIFWRVAREIRESERHGYRAIKGTGCQTTYGWCPYKSLCWHDNIDGYLIKEPKETSA